MKRGYTYRDVRPSTYDDVSNVLNAYIESTRVMLSQGIDQWSYNYPNIHNVEKDIKNKISFLIEGKSQVGVIVLDNNEDEQYAKLKWPFKSKNPLVIHRLAVHPELQGFGVGKALCIFAEYYALKNGNDSIRLDAYSTNNASNQLYFRLGYERASGFCYFHHNSKPFICFEKKIKNV